MEDIVHVEHLNSPIGGAHHEVAPGLVYGVCFQCLIAVIRWSHFNPVTEGFERRLYVESIKAQMQIS
jgi:hypothetical protein